MEQQLLEQILEHPDYGVLNLILYDIKERTPPRSVMRYSPYVEMAEFLRINGVLRVQFRNKNDSDLIEAQIEVIDHELIDTLISMKGLGIA